MSQHARILIPLHKTSLEFRQNHKSYRPVSALHFAEPLSQKIHPLRCTFLGFPVGKSVRRSQCSSDLHCCSTSIQLSDAHLGPSPHLISSRGFQSCGSALHLNVATLLPAPHRGTCSLRLYDSCTALSQHAKRVSASSLGMDGSKRVHVPPTSLWCSTQSSVQKPVAIPASHPIQVLT